MTQISTLFMTHKLNGFSFRWRKSFCSKIIAFRSSQLISPLEPAFLQPKKKKKTWLIICYLKLWIFQRAQQSTFAGKRKQTYQLFCAISFSSSSLDDKKVYINFLDFTEIENSLRLCFFPLFRDVFFSFLVLFCHFVNEKLHVWEISLQYFIGKTFLCFYLFFVRLGSVKEGTWCDAGGPKVFWKQPIGKCIIKSQTWLENLIWVSDRGSLNI